MFKNLNLTQKVIASVVAVLLTTSLLSFWITEARVNRQADAAFLDKVRQITGMAGTTRVWFSQNIEKLVPNHDYKYIEQVPVVVSWKVAQLYAQKAGMEFRTPSLRPRNPKNEPDGFEREALSKFQDDPGLKEYSARVTENGREWLRYAQPVRLTQDCLVCHGDPAGTKDAFGHIKEGMKVGDLRGAFALKAPVDELLANASSNFRMLFLTSLFTLLAAAIAVALAVRATVITPIAEVHDLLVGLAGGDLTKRIVVRTRDEVGQMAEALNVTVENMSEVLGKIEVDSAELTRASERLSTTSQNISANSEETSAQANTVSTATDEVNRNLQTVATATEEMSASIQEIAKNATEAAKVAGEATRTATAANTTVSKLGDSSAEIGKVIKMITSIAQKTDLLALNATVEAARAGEVGAGFAVVANEVKELAKQTALATQEVSQRIEAIRTDSQEAVDAIKAIDVIIDRVNQISSTIATAVEEQSATTSEMARNLTEATRGSAQVAQNISGVAEAAQSTSHGAEDSRRAAMHLAKISAQLQEVVRQFKLRPKEPKQSQRSEGFMEDTMQDEEPVKAGVR